MRSKFRDHSREVRKPRCLDTNILISNSKIISIECKTFSRVLWGHLKSAVQWYVALARAPFTLH